MSHDDRGDRPKLSWAEIDRRRDKPRERSEQRPRGAAAEARSREATSQYLKKLDKHLFAKGSNPSVEETLARTVRDAQGSPGLADACRAYLEQVGPPRDPALASAFLDAPDRELQLAALEALSEGLESEAPRPSGGLRTQLRMLSEGMDDELAEAAETVLDKL